MFASFFRIVKILLEILEYEANQIWRQGSRKTRN